MAGHKGLAHSQIPAHVGALQTQGRLGDLSTSDGPFGRLFQPFELTGLCHLASTSKQPLSS